LPPVFLFDGVCCCAARPRPSCSEAPSTGGPGQRWRGGIKQPSNLQHKDSHIQHSSRQAAQYHWKQSPSQAASEPCPHPSVAQGILDTCTPLGRIHSIPHESLSRTPTTALVTNADSCSGISAASRHTTWTGPCSSGSRGPRRLLRQTSKRAASPLSPLMHIARSGNPS